MMISTQKTNKIYKNRMIPIKSTHVDGLNILIVDETNKLWIMGENRYRKTGFGIKDQTIYSPVSTGITLDNDEEVKKFYSYAFLMSIYTTSGKLYLSRNLDNKNGSPYASRYSSPILNSSPVFNRPRSATVNAGNVMDWPGAANEWAAGAAAELGVASNLNWEGAIADSNWEGTIGRSNWEGAIADSNWEGTIGRSNWAPDLAVPTVAPEIVGEINLEVDPVVVPEVDSAVVLQVDSAVIPEVGSAVVSEVDPVVIPNVNPLPFVDMNGDFSDFIEFLDSDPTPIQPPVDSDSDSDPIPIQSPVRPPIQSPVDSDSDSESEAPTRPPARRIHSDSDSDSDSGSECSFNCSHHRSEFTFELPESATEDDIHNHIFNNNHFHSIISSIQKKNRQEVGIDLFEENVEDVLYLQEFILFKKNGSLFLFGENLNPVKMVLDNTFGLTYIPMGRNDYVYYKIVFPFDIDQIIFREEFLYLSSGSRHHVLSVSDKVDGDGVLIWIYFKPDFEVKPENIHYSSSEVTAYVINDNIVYKYSFRTGEMREFAKDNIKAMMVKCTDGTSSLLFCIKEDGLYVDNGVLQKDIDKNDLVKYVIDENPYNDSQFAVIDHAETKRFEVKGQTLFFNIHGLDYYQLIDSGLLYFDVNTLCFCSTEVLAENKYNTMEVEKIAVGNENYYIYMFKDLPFPVTNISFATNLILLQSGNKYYYHNICDCSEFSVNKFTEIVLEVEKETMVYKNYIVRSTKYYDEHVTCSVATTAKKFKTLLGIIELFRKRCSFDINTYNGTVRVSYGDGPKREFMESALEEFSEKYLIRHNICTEFNLETMKNLSDDRLSCIGMVLHSVICQSENYLSIRLPLSLVSAICGKEPKISELEYFAGVEDPMAFEAAHEFKDEEELIKSFGFDSYSDCLKMLCKYYCYEEDVNKQIRELSGKIATGFKYYNEVKNLNIMNVPTLDYFLSGECLIDRKLLLKKLSVQNSDSGVDYAPAIKKMITDLSEENLAILLKNWSGTSVVKKSETYYITITKKPTEIRGNTFAFNFATCSINLYIWEQMIEKPDSIPALIDLLIVPMNSMVDP